MRYINTQLRLPCSPYHCQHCTALFIQAVYIYFYYCSTFFFLLFASLFLEDLPSTNFTKTNSFYLYLAKKKKEAYSDSNSNSDTIQLFVDVENRIKLCYLFKTD